LNLSRSTKIGHNMFYLQLAGIMFQTIFVLGSIQMVLSAYKRRKQ